MEFRAYGLEYREAQVVLARHWSRWLEKLRQFPAVRAPEPKKHGMVNIVQALK